MSRDATLDTLRGLAMILVVFGHALIGAMAAGYDTPLVRVLILVIYSTHMALFFAVSGLLSRGMAQRGWAEVLRRIGVRLLWPYLLWSLVLLSAHYLMSGHTNVALTRFEPWTILWHPPAIMWFLYALILAMLLMRLLAPLPHAVMAGAGLVLMALAYLVPLVPLAGRFVGLFLIACAAGPGALARLDRPVWIALSGGVMVVVLWLAMAEAGAPLTGYPAGSLAYLPALVAGPFLLLRVSRWMARMQPTLAAAFAYVGERTMPIFVTHILITAGVRIVARAAGVTEWWAIILAATGLGVALPLAALSVADRLGLSRGLGWR
ncbi:acyltransferase family protein [Pseudooceanicola sp.]|uniref:acyltransferase family protein n=1 Tax=Pseudooceanicola sp. TaxID=1914328 RepID=UPI0035C700A1